VKVAETVVIRDKPNYKFEVDGEDFPWWVSEKAPQVTQVMDDLFTVKVEIFGGHEKIGRYGDGDEMLRVGRTDVPIRVEGYQGKRLFIGDVEFPWDMTADGYRIECGMRILPTITLSFLARDVDSDMWIDDSRWIENINGDTYAFPPENSKTWHPEAEVNADG
jgi:hypothetical protein